MTLVAEPLTTISITPLESPDPSPYQRLAEAIEKGALLTGHAAGTFVNAAGATCALGAAVVGLGGTLRWTNERILIRLPNGADGYGMTTQGLLKRCGIDLPNDYITHPVNGTRNDLLYTIVTLNDRYEWSREWIATWLRSLG